MRRTLGWKSLVLRRETMEGLVSDLSTAQRVVCKWIAEMQFSFALAAQIVMAAFVLRRLAAGFVLVLVITTVA